MSLHSLVVRLDPDSLANPDTDLRHLVPERIRKVSDGVLVEDGYDYCGEPPFLLLFFQTEDLDVGLSQLIRAVETERILGNDLREGTLIAVDRSGIYDVMYPEDAQEPFAPWSA